ncbi:MAG: Uma2 family endonuclease [Methylococcaceae bacterium]|nr:Uma2 family endonuclease [Methylococcaceae bacterium]
MQWSEVLQDNSLSNLPYKIELNEYGQILMSPASNQHGLLQVEIAFFLRANKQGKVITECSIDTPKGVKVADVAWGSENFFLNNGVETPYLTAPEICVEIVSPSNSSQEMSEKTNLYLQQGAKEVWICEQNGSATIYNTLGKTPTSEFFANLPLKFEY